MFLAVDPVIFRADIDWPHLIDWRLAGVRPESWRDASYGDLWSRHIVMRDGLEVEFGFARLSWAGCNPVDAGTERVVVEGFRALYDPDARFAALMATVQRTRP